MESSAGCVGDGVCGCGGARVCGADIVAVVRDRKPIAVIKGGKVLFIVGMKEALDFDGPGLPLT